MSFTSPFSSFGPLPTPPTAPLSGLSGLEAAIQRLQAISPTPVSRDAAPPSLARARRLCERLLAECEPEVRPCLRRIFEQTLEAVAADLALPPTVSCRWQAARRRLTPVPLLTQQQRLPCAQTEEPPREQSHAELDRLLRQAIWRVVDALEAYALLPSGDAYQPLLVEQCTQMRRMYRRVQGRAGVFFAPLFLQGELRFLHHRGSAVVESLLLS